MTGQTRLTASSPSRTPAVPATTPLPKSPGKASEAASSIPTNTGDVVQPLSVGDYSLPKKPDGVAEKRFERRSALKQLGNPKENGVALGRLEASGKSYFDHGPGVVQGRAKGQAAATALTAKFEHEHTGRLGHTKVSGEAEVGARVKGEVGGKLSRPDATVVAHASAEGFAGARGELHVEQKQGRHFSQSVDGAVKAGASATATATFAFEPKKGTALAKVGFDALAGAKESASGEVKVGVVRLSGGISAQQGVGSSFQVGAGIKDGRAMLSVDVGAAVGLGVSVNVGVAVNARAIAHNAHAASHAVKDAAHTAGHAVKDAARTAGHAVKEAAHGVGHAVKDAAHAVKDAAHHHRHTSKP